MQRCCSQKLEKRQWLKATPVYHPDMVFVNVKLEENMGTMPEGWVVCRENGQLENQTNKSEHGRSSGCSADMIIDRE